MKIGNDLHEEVFVTKVILAENETQQIITNIANNVNTNNGIVIALAFVSGQSPFDAGRVSINLSNIDYIEKRND